MSPGRYMMLLGMILGMSAGCTFAEMNSIARTFDVENNGSKLIDIKQRSILVAKVPDPGAAPVRDVRTGQNRPATRPAVCAEPSPDALTVFASSIAASGATPQGISAQVAGTLAEGGSFVGLRTQSIQALRDAYYRLCEAYLSGAIGAAEYDILLRRFQSNMIGIIAIEQLTGAVVAASTTLTGAATADAGTNLAQVQAHLTKARERVVALRKRETELKQISDNPPGSDDAEKAAAKKAADDELGVVRTEIGEQEKNIAALEKALENARSLVATAEVTSSTPVGPSFAQRPTGADLKEVAGTVERITLSMVNADFSGQLCFSLLKEGDLENQAGPIVKIYCSSHLTEIINRRKAQITFLQEVNEMIKACRLGLVDESSICAAALRAEVIGSGSSGSPTILDIEGFLMQEF